MNQLLIDRWLKSSESLGGSRTLSDSDLDELYAGYKAVMRATEPFGIRYQLVYEDARLNANKLEAAIGHRMHVRMGK